ncbi:hypothetical protein [Stenotrophomonas maltophilia]
MKKVPLRHLLLCAVIAGLIGGTYLSMFGSTGGADWTGKPTEAELRAATETFELPSGSHPTNVKFLPKVTFLGPSSTPNSNLIQSRSPLSSSNKPQRSGGDCRKTNGSAITD